MCIRDSHGWIFTKFGIGVVVADVMTLAKFLGSQLRDVNSVWGGVENGGFLLTKPLAVKTLLTRLHCD